MKAWIVWTLTVLALGVALGRCGSGTPPVERVEVERPARTVVKKVDKPYLPAPCVRAVDMAVTIRDTAGKFDTVSGSQLDLMEQAAKAIIEGDIQQINKHVTAQRNLRLNTNSAAETLQSQLSTYGQVLAECKKELG